MPPVQTETKERPQNRLEGTGPYGATLKQGVLSRPLDVAQEPIDSVEMVNDRGAALDAAPGAAVAQSVIGCEIKTKGIKFGKRKD
ncbi:hypothetical protein RRF57_007912 [Xylaria bambusicola]|uniref:Uncharacterized protein n=1 Tax=Xylaria bambusicola TaxID=326684 RepID=A0AAN7ZB28_9PEZI